MRKNYHRQGDGLKTEKQWARENKKPLDVAQGTELRTSISGTRFALFYAADQVRDMTAEELAEKKAAVRAKTADLKRRKLFSAHLMPDYEWKQMKMTLKAADQCMRTEYTPYPGLYHSKPHFPWLSSWITYWHEDDVIPDPDFIPIPVPELHRRVSVPENPIRAVIVDVETTGLSLPGDEILQIGMIDYDTGNILMDVFVKPEADRWPDAQEINHITPGMVALAPDITQFIPEINEILALSSKVIGYNTWFDLNFLSASGVAVPEKIEVIDVMKDFAPIYGQWSEKYGDFKFQSLSTCTSYYGYTWPDDGTPHDAIADCKATAYCHRKMTADNETE